MYIIVFILYIKGIHLTVAKMAPCGDGGAVWRWWSRVAMVEPCGDGGAVWRWWRRVAMVKTSPCGGSLIVCIFCS